MQIELVNQQVKTCVYCPFQEYNYNKNKELGFGRSHRIMFVGLCPSVSSNKSQGFSSFDIYLSKLLVKVEITEEDYYFTNLCKTSIPHDVILSEEQVKHCLAHLVKEIIAIKPQIIVLFGKQTRDAFDINWPETVVKRIFSANGEKHKTVLYTLQHPGFLKYKPEEEERYLMNLRKIFKVYQKQLF